MHVTLSKYIEIQYITLKHTNTLHLLWPALGQAIIFLPCGFFLLLSFLFLA